MESSVNQLFQTKDSHAFQLWTWIRNRMRMMLQRPILYLQSFAGQRNLLAGLGSACCFWNQCAGFTCLTASPLPLLMDNRKMSAVWLQLTRSISSIPELLSAMSAAVELSLKPRKTARGISLTIIATLWHYWSVLKNFKEKLNHQEKHLEQFKTETVSIQLYCQNLLPALEEYLMGTENPFTFSIWWKEYNPFI